VNPAVQWDVPTEPLSIIVLEGVEDVTAA